MYLMSDVIVLDQFDCDTIEMMFSAEIEFKETVITKECLVELVRQAEEKAAQGQYNSTCRVMMQHAVKWIKDDAELLGVSFNG